MVRRAIGGLGGILLRWASWCGVGWWMDVSSASVEPDTDAPGPVLVRLQLVLRGMLAVLGMWRLEPYAAVLVYRRIAVLGCRLERMLRRFQAGLLRHCGPRGARTGGMRPGGALRATPGVRLPRRFGWLAQAGGSEAVCRGLQLQAVLTSPEMAALLAASPQAVRLVRPLCRALAVELPGVSGPGAPRARRVAAAPRVRRPRPTLPPFRIPLPRGVLSAARRAGFGRDLPA